MAMSVKLVRPPCTHARCEVPLNEALLCFVNCLSKAGKVILKYKGCVLVLLVETMPKFIN
jgi:hypothetical protein